MSECGQIDCFIIVTVIMPAYSVNTIDDYFCVWLTMTLFSVVVLFRLVFENSNFFSAALFNNFRCNSSTFHEWNAYFHVVSTYE